MCAYSHQGHGPRADQTGRIHISDFRNPRTISVAKRSRSIHLGQSRLCWPSRNSADARYALEAEVKSVAAGVSRCSPLASIRPRKGCPSILALKPGSLGPGSAPTTLSTSRRRRRGVLGYDGLGPKIWCANKCAGYWFRYPLRCNPDIAPRLSRLAIRTIMLQLSWFRRFGLRSS